MWPVSNDPSPKVDLKALRFRFRIVEFSQKTFDSASCMMSGLSCARMLTVCVVLLLSFIVAVRPCIFWYIDLIVFVGFGLSVKSVPQELMARGECCCCGSLVVLLMVLVLLIRD